MIFLLALGLLMPARAWPAAAVAPRAPAASWAALAAGLPPASPGNFSGLDPAALLRLLEKSPLPPEAASPAEAVRFAVEARARSLLARIRPAGAGDLPSAEEAAEMESDLADLSAVEPLLSMRTRREIRSAVRSFLPSAGDIEAFRQAGKWTGIIPDFPLPKAKKPGKVLAESFLIGKKSAADGLLTAVEFGEDGERREALKGLEKIDWTPANRERLRLRFLGADEEMRRSLAGLIAGKALGFSNAMQLFLWLCPRHEEAIRDFFPGLRVSLLPSPEDLVKSVFASEALMDQWGEHVRRMKAESPGAYAAWIKTRPARGILRACFAVRVPGEGGRIREMGFLLPYSIGGDGTAGPGRAEEVITVSQNAAAGRLGEGFREKYSIFDRLIDANFQALKTLSSMAGRPEPGAVRALISEVRGMLGLFERLDPSSKGPREAFERLAREMGSSPDPRSVFEIDPARPMSSLHSLVNWMHQQALSLFSGPHGAAAFTGAIETPTISVGFGYLGEAPLPEALSANPGVRSLLSELRRIPCAYKDALFFSEDRLWAHAVFGLHSAEIFADFSEPDEGGLLRIRYQESGYPGSSARLAMIGAFLGALGVPVRIEGGQHLDALWDKDHGLSSSRRAAQALPFILRFLHETADLDLMFGNSLEELGEAGVAEMARRMGEIYAAEGEWPFSVFEDPAGKFKAYEAGGRALREALRRRLDAELGRLGLPPIPAGAALGQRTVDRLFTRAVEEAAALGQLSWKGGARPEPLSYDPLGDLVEAVLSDPAGSTRKAISLDAMELEFVPVGLAGALRAERAQERLADGSILAVFALREMSSGRLAFADAWTWTLEGGKRPWRGEGERAWNGPQIERLLALMRSPIAAEAGARALGMGSSPGIASGPVSFDRANGPAGSILAAPFTTPDDLAAIARSAGVITTGGGALSHASITTRELGLPSVILPDGRWGKGSLGLGFVRQGEIRRLPGGVQAAGLEPVEDPVLREGDRVRIDGKSGAVELVRRGP
jgi:phosphohistidine swiveling domain-containing protein